MKTQHTLVRGVPMLILAVFLAARFAGAAEPQIPQQAKVIQARFIPVLKLAVREWISQEAKKVSRSSVMNEAAVKADIQTRFVGQSLAGGDIETLILLVMTEAAQDAEKDLKAAMAEMKATNEKKPPSARQQTSSSVKKPELKPLPDRNTRVLRPQTFRCGRDWSNASQSISRWKTPRPNSIQRTRWAKPNRSACRWPWTGSRNWRLPFQTC